MLEPNHNASNAPVDSRQTQTVPYVLNVSVIVSHARINLYRYALMIVGLPITLLTAFVTNVHRIVYLAQTMIHVPNAKMDLW